MTHPQKRHAILTLLASVLILITFIFCINTLSNLNKIAGAQSEVDPATIAWQYSLLIAEYHRFDHQLDRAILSSQKQHELENLCLRFHLLSERIIEAEAISKKAAAASALLPLNMQPFLKLKKFILDTAYLGEKETRLTTRDHLVDATTQLHKLENELTTIALSAAQLSSESNNQKRRHAHQEANEYQTLIFLLFLIFIILLLLNLWHLPRSST